MQVEQHVVEGHHAQLALGLAQRPRAVLEQAAQQAQAGQAQRALALRQRIQPALNRVKAGMGRRWLVFLGAFL